MSDSENASDIEMFSTTAHINERDRPQLMELSSDNECKTMFNDSEDEYDWDSIDIDMCSVIAEIDDRDQEELLEFAEDHNYIYQMFVYEHVEDILDFNVVMVKDIALDSDGGESAIPLYPYFPQRDVVLDDDLSFEATRHLIGVKESISVNFIVEGGYDTNDTRESLYNLCPNIRDNENEQWITDLFNQQCKFVAQYIYRFMNDGRSTRHDNSDIHHHNKHNEIYHTLYKSQPLEFLLGGRLILPGIEEMQNGIRYETDELHTYRCRNEHWYVYLDVEALNHPQDNASVIKVFLKRAPVLGTVKPFSLQSLAASAVVSALLNDSYSNKTCANLLYLTQQTKSLSKLSFRCGRNSSRFMYSFNSIVKNYCFRKILSKEIQNSLYYDTIKINPKPFCIHCLDITCLRRSLYLCPTYDCAVCKILRSSMFSTTFESMNGHLNDCKHNVG